MKKQLTILLLVFIAMPVFAMEKEKIHSTEHHHHEPMKEEMMHKNLHEGEKFQKKHETKEYMHHQDLKGNPTPSAQAYMHANHKMHEGMAIEFIGNADLDFLKGMIPHHEGAVNMAKIQLEHGENGVLKYLTQGIIRDQEREIRIMKRLVEMVEKQSLKNPNIKVASIDEFKKTNHKMHREMNIQYSGNADIDFVKGMIPHHQGAIDMAKVVLKYGQNSNVKNLAINIINAQQSEITWMKKWLHLQRLMKIRFKN